MNVLEGISTTQFSSSLISRGLIVRDGDLVDNNKLLGWLPPTAMVERDAGCLLWKHEKKLENQVMKKVT